MKEDAPNETTNSAVKRITWQNLDGPVYRPEPGMEYEIAEGCIRVLNRPFYDVEIQASKLIKTENLEQMDPGQPDFSPTVRLKVMQLVTSGDDVPAIGVDMDVVSRVVTDFFMMRIYRGQKQTG